MVFNNIFGDLGRNTTLSCIFFKSTKTLAMINYIFSCVHHKNTKLNDKQHIDRQISSKT